MEASERTVDSLARSDLELPLGRHHLGVDARNLDSSVQARPLCATTRPIQTRVSTGTTYVPREDVWEEGDSRSVPQ